MNEQQRNSLLLFGQFLIENFGDFGLQYFDDVLSLDPAQIDQNRLGRLINNFDESQIETLKKCIALILSQSMHSFLYALRINADFDGNIDVLSNGLSIAKISDGIEGELYGEDGWITVFSKYRDIYSGV